jgi:phosphatidylinositol kinase/protein kinase (PI-3  family)
MLIHAMEVCGINGTFSRSCEVSMEVLRENRESLMAVLEAFVYDPLLAWRLTATNQPGGRVTDEKEMVEDGVNARQRKSKANEADVLGGESPSALPRAGAYWGIPQSKARASTEMLTLQMRIRSK